MRRCANHNCRRPIPNIRAPYVVVVKDSKTGDVQRVYCRRCGSKPVGKRHKKRAMSSWVSMSLMYAKNLVKQN